MQLLRQPARRVTPRAGPQVEVTDRVGLLHDVTQALWERELTGAARGELRCTCVRALTAARRSAPRARVHEPQ